MTAVTIRIPAGIAVCTIMLTSCTGAGTPAETPTNPSPGPRLLVATEKHDGALQAAVSGVFAVDAAGCVTVAGMTLIAPLGSRLEPDGRIHLEGIGDYALGDELPITASSYGSAAEAKPEHQGCTGHDLVAVYAT
ncbi:hypothetical protein [Microlunatus speluncae]|uniref:hypothetical protein n=1 Tax=Microlunatus speluncae TaxID=2594267 RepID=UPI0012660A23|nr:hypothetical protein [Microlunatus speluncae]